MSRRALSVTLDTTNVTWLKGRAGASGESVSQVLDQIVTAARSGGTTRHVRSVVGTIDLATADPQLNDADRSIRAIFETSLARPVVVREPRTPYRRGPRPKRRG